MATVTTVTYSANTAITFDLSSLAASTSFLSGRESTLIDNTSTQYVDALVSVLGITDGATAPVVGQMIQLYVWGANVSPGTTAIDTLVGTDGARTLTHDSIRQALKFAAAPLVTVATASLVYYIQPFSVAVLFGGDMPKYWGLFAAHNHAGALAAAMSAKFSFNGITYTST